MTAKLLAVAMCVSAAFGGSCYIDDSLLEAINAIEGHPAKEPRYAYIISFNNAKDASLAREAGLGGWLDKRTVDCGSKEVCAELTETLTANGIKNLDLGAYQINYIYHKFGYDEYFDNAKAEYRVCEILLALYESKGWSWQTLGLYHSSNPKRNEFYRTLLAKKYAEATR
jgi:hypothetical protein